MRKTLIIASVLTLFLAAGFAPAVLAKDGDGNRTQEEREQAKQERRDARDEAKEERKDARGEGRHMKFVKSNVSLELSGTALGKDNETYTFNLTASGQAVDRVKVKKADKADANSTENATEEKKVRYHARMLAHVVIKDANGTIVQEGDVRVKLFARSGDNETKWILGSIGKKESGMPKLVLKGNATTDGDGVFDLVGKGKLVFKAGDENRATPVKLPLVSGTFTRQA